MYDMIRVLFIEFSFSQQVSNGMNTILTHVKLAACVWIIQIFMSATVF